jgi:TatD DNase family protein
MTGLANQLDTHCHVDQYGDPVALAAKLEAGGPRAICVSLCPSDWQRNRDRFADAERIFPAVGLIPQEIDTYGAQIPDLLAGIAETRFIGEVGLDYVTDDLDNRRRQRRLLNSILETAACYGDRILTIHSRRAADDVVAAIGADFPGRAILHWYSGALAHIENAPDSTWFSINTAMATSRSGRKIIAATPAERLLLETDGPYVHVGDRPATPFDLHLVIERIAAIRNWPIEEARAQLADNARKLLS